MNRSTTTRKIKRRARARPQMPPISAAGFTLVEIMVSVTIFSFVMLMVVSMLLAIVEANVKAQTLKTTLDNLNIALDEMSRTVRTGDRYTVPSCSQASPCSTFSFYNQEGQPEVFAFSQDHSICGAGTSGCITRTINNGPTIALTGTDVNITGGSFILYHQYTSGVATAQPYVVMLVQGLAGTGSTESTFSIETAVSERVFGSGL